MDFVHADTNGGFVSRDMCHDFVWVFSGNPQNLDESVSEFVTLSLEELDNKIIDVNSDVTKAFQAHYAGLRSELYAFREELVA